MISVGGSLRKKLYLIRLEKILEVGQILYGYININFLGSVENSCRKDDMEFEKGSGRS